MDPTESTPTTTEQPEPHVAEVGSGRIIAGGRLLDHVANAEVRGTLDDIASQIQVRAEDLVPALAELSEVGWVTVRPDADGRLVLKLSDDAR